jgi:hypothetical protein
LRTTTPWPIRRDIFRNFGQRPVALLNTVDVCYGHSVFRLIQAQHYLDHANVDLVVLVQPSLRWMVPSGVAQIWTVDAPWKEAWRWNDGLAQEVKRLLAGHSPVFLCRPFVQPDTAHFDVERFTGVRPFPLTEWTARLQRPTVTFIWRSDRSWRDFITPFMGLRRAAAFLNDWKIRRQAGMPASILGPGPLQMAAPSAIKRWIKKVENRSLQRKQRDWIVRLAGQLRECVPNLDFGVAGLMNKAPSFPRWIQDCRRESHSDESARRMCERYASSHIVLGCNGSNLVLPGMHAGAVVNLVPRTWWAVSAGSFPFRYTEPPDIAFRYVLVPGEVSVGVLGDILVSILRDRELILLHTASQWRSHQTQRPLSDWASIARRAMELKERFREPPSSFSAVN